MIYECAVFSILNSDQKQHSMWTKPIWKYAHDALNVTINTDVKYILNSR